MKKYNINELIAILQAMETGEADPEGVYFRIDENGVTYACKRTDEFGYVLSAIDGWYIHQALVFQCEEMNDTYLLTNLVGDYLCDTSKKTREDYDPDYIYIIKNSLA